jgi:hypothetical protein
MAIFRNFELRVFAIACLGAFTACSQPDSNPGTGAGGSGSGTAGNSGSAGSGSTGSAGTTGSGGNASGGNASGGNASGSAGNVGTTGASGATGAGGSSAAGSSGAGGASGSAGNTGNTGMAGSASAGRGGASGAAGASGAGGTGGSSTGAVTITGLKIDPNPKNVLSCFVSWTTNTAANSVVQFGVGGYQFEIADSAQVTSHKVTVIGMKQMKSYMIKAISGSASAEGTFMTMAVPATIPVASITAMDATKTQPGWTLMNIQKGDGSASARSNNPAQAVMYDVDGQPVWYYIDGTMVDRGGAISVDLTDKGVLIGATLNNNLANGEPPREVDFAGNTIFECSSANCGRSGNLTHHVSKLPNGNYMMLRDVSESGGTTPNFEEVTPTNTVVWSVAYTKFVPKPSALSGDWCHGNSITVNMAKNEMYFNCRFMGLVKATYMNPTVKWHLPAKYNGASITNAMKFVPPTSQYTDTHDPEIHDDGTVLVFDNGGFSGTIEDGNPRNYHSRALEYKIDETANTATLVWEFPGTFQVDSWYTTQFYLPFWGDADRLANGNVLVTAGRRGTMVRSRIFEVTKADGKVVWEFQLPLDFGVYRSERITPPLVRAITN